MKRARGKKLTPDDIREIAREDEDAPTLGVYFWMLFMKVVILVAAIVSIIYLF